MSLRRGKKPLARGRLAKDANHVTFTFLVLLRDSFEVITIEM
jgi:hypothetical protein